MGLRYNPVTGEYEVNPNSYTMGVGDDYIDNYVPEEPNPYVPDADYSNEGRNYPNTESTQGPGGSPVNATTYSWMSQLPSGLQNVLKGLTSPAGIAGLGGAALGYLNRPQPSGGGTTMAYPGAQQITRKIVQGPYGPLAEYSGFSMPDYGTGASALAPSAPAPAPRADMPVQSKIDQYKTLQGYGLAPVAIRRIAESIYGPQTDVDWAELVRQSGSSGGISAPTAPSSTGAGIGSPNIVLAQKSPELGMKKLKEWLDKYSQRLSRLSPQDRAQVYRGFLEEGVADADIRKMIEQYIGEQTNKDWGALQQLAAGLYAKGGVTQGYARGGTVQMEDGGFVMTKRAVDGAGGPQGIQQLVPGARLIRGPGTGTSDSIPATIQGPNGVTPAKVSNGEAYVPRAAVQQAGGPRRMYALMNRLQRKA